MVQQNEVKKEFDVAVVGSSVVGLTAALALANLNYKVALLGPKGEPFQPSATQLFDSRVFAINKRSQNLLERLHVWKNLNHERIQPVSKMYVWGDQVGSSNGGVGFDAADVAVSQLNWIVEQHELIRVLSTAVSYQPGVQLFESLVLNMHPAGSGWQLETAENKFEVPLVISADGANSFTRKLAGLDFEYESFGSQAVVSTWQTEFPHKGIARQWFNGRDVLALLPLAGSYVSMVWSMPTFQASAFSTADSEQQIDMLEQTANASVHRHYGDLKQVGEVLSYPLKRGVAPVWFENQVALIGDAAHVVHPLAGLGLNLGLEDIVELMRHIESKQQLGLEKQGILADKNLWKSWQRKRKAACVSVNLLTSGLHHLFCFEAPGASMIRNLGMNFVNKMPSLKRWLCSQAMR